MSPVFHKALVKLQGVFQLNEILQLSPALNATVKLQRSRHRAFPPPKKKKKKNPPQQQPPHNHNKTRPVINIS